MPQGNGQRKEHRVARIQWLVDNQKEWTHIDISKADCQIKDELILLTNKMKDLDLFSHETHWFDIRMRSYLKKAQELINVRKQ